MKSVKIGKYEIEMGGKPFVVAEMSGNHNQSLERALEIVAAAAKAGAHAIKLQTYKPETMTLNVERSEFRIQDPKSLWSGRHLFDLYREAHTPWEWHKRIFDFCNTLGLLCFSTPFDETAVDFLETLDVPCYKVASFENTDIPLIKKIAKTGKPVIISTGMATISELEEVVGASRKAGIEDLILLKCTSAYPAEPFSINLRTIPHMSEMFSCPVGLSDHTMGTGVSVASVALGAPFIEKHFTLSRKDGGVDSAFSLEPAEFAELTQSARVAWEALGRVQYDRSVEETKSLAFRRSIFVTKTINAGETINKENVKCVRPGFGLPPKHWEAVMGCIAKIEMAPGTPLSWNLIEAKS
jgi:pseudaminic acid synthase